MTVEQAREISAGWEERFNYTQRALPRIIRGEHPRASLRLRHLWRKKREKSDERRNNRVFNPSSSMPEMHSGICLIKLTWINCALDTSIIKIISNLRFNQQSRADRSQMPKQGVQHSSTENGYEGSLVSTFFDQEIIDTACVISHLSRIFELYRFTLIGFTGILYNSLQSI